MGKKKAGPELKGNEGGEEEKRTRVKNDYCIEVHSDGGDIVSVGIILHYPSEADIVVAWLEKHMEELGFDGKIRICQRRYS